MQTRCPRRCSETCRTQFFLSHPLVIIHQVFLPDLLQWSLPNDGFPIQPSSVFINWLSEVRVLSSLHLFLHISVDSLDDFCSIHRLLYLHNYLFGNAFPPYLESLSHCPLCPSAILNIKFLAQPDALCLSFFILQSVIRHRLQRTQALVRGMLFRTRILEPAVLMAI